MEQPPISNSEETIFPESEFSMEGYDKHIRNARVMLFVLAGLFLLSLVSLTPFDDNPLKLVMAGIIILFAAAYVALAFWTKKKPYSAILTALILFISLEVLSFLLQPASIFQGWILKIIVILLLLLGLRNAKESQQMMEAYGKKG
jgi:hypothetical membrane protein